MFSAAQLDTFYRYSYSLTLNEAEAYDLLQNALEKILKSKSKKINPSAFMYTTIRHQFIDDYRMQKKYEAADFKDNEFVDIDLKTLETLVIEDDLLEQVLHFLEPLEREILFYWSIEGYSTQQVATLLKMPKGTVLSKIYRMRQRIKKQFNGDTLIEPLVINEGAKQ